MAWFPDEQERETWLRFVQSLSPEVDPQAVSLMDEMGLVARTIMHTVAHSLDETGLSHAQYRVLMHLFFAEHLDEQGELNPSEISARQRVSRNAMSSLIRNLEDEELVERHLDPEDRRRFNIRLTEKGRALVIDNARQHLAMISHCFSVLDADERQRLYQLLRKVSAHVKVPFRGAPHPHDPERRPDAERRPEMAA
jgi:MarR family 2-MHQ and catechol resistance regulon transcriptional repressor